MPALDRSLSDCRDRQPYVYRIEEDNMKVRSISIDCVVPR